MPGYGGGWSSSPYHNTGRGMVGVSPGSNPNPYPFPETKYQGGPRNPFQLPGPNMGIQFPGQQSDAPPPVQRPAGKGPQAPQQPWGGQRNPWQPPGGYGGTMPTQSGQSQYDPYGIMAPQAGASGRYGQSNPMQQWMQQMQQGGYGMQYGMQYPGQAPAQSTPASMMNWAPTQMNTLGVF